MVVVEIIFWASLALLVHTHVGYPAMLAALTDRGRRERKRQVVVGRPRTLPSVEAQRAYPKVALIIAAHDEEDVISLRVANALALEYPRERVEIVVACDGCTDRTAELAREAGADRVIELERAGKVAAQNAAVAESGGTILAFSDANSFWEPGALGALVDVLADESVGYVCGQLVLEGQDGENQEGVYWRYELAVREMESDLAGITAGNGAIYALRRDSYVFLAPTSGHDLALPPELARAGLRSLYVPTAVAREQMAPSTSVEYSRKRRMMARTWSILLRSNMLNPIGYRPAYLFELYSHRLLRYASPFLHVALLAASLALLGHGFIFVLALAGQLALLAGAALAGRVPITPFRLARYYVAVTASSASGLLDYLRGGPQASWERAEGAQ